MGSTLSYSAVGKGVDRLDAEPREFEEFRVNLPAVLLYDRIERDCVIETASATELSLTSELKPSLFETAIVYSDLLGRLECQVVRTRESGFTGNVQTTAAKREKLADILKWIAAQIVAGRSFHRVHERIVPKRRQSWLRVRDQVIPCILHDISRAGAGVISPVMPEVNSLVTIGSQRARVVRSIPNGFAVEFLRLVPVDVFGEDFVP